ncbi:MAG: DUF4230 domain-containing protein [Crocinitomicaceae bacterium]|nr:DUF4230 domain-containing protein [Crocinitomicaceae bacterium]
MKQLLAILLASITLFSCSDDKRHPKVDVYEIRNIGELSTTEYTVGKIIKLDDVAKEWYKYGDRKILINCKAKIKAGVDLSKLKEGDIEVSGNIIEITLPPAKIISFTMDSKHIATEMESVSGFRDGFTHAEKNNFLKQGEAAIKKEIIHTDIIKDAQQNAEVFLEDFYKQLGFEKVIIRQKEADVN